MRSATAEVAGASVLLLELVDLLEVVLEGLAELA